ncbi:MAG: hypothetical protein [Olavius algarvensis Gamma 1 endosymbiont]|nr:MAG: hypothetical protein [Olavius algarvensis Gamma 1 endosymbiont]
MNQSTRSLQKSPLPQNVAHRIPSSHRTNNFIITPALIPRGNFLQITRKEFLQKIE